jgi:hypothetical protein
MLIKRFIYGILLVCTAAMLLFISGYICFKLSLPPVFASLFYLLAEKIMLAGFLLLILLGIIATTNALLHDIRAYFRKDAAALRRLLAVHNRKIQQIQLKTAKIRQIHYFNRIKHQRILAKDNQKQLTQLYRAILQELQAVRQQLAANEYQTLYTALRNHHKQANADAMLAIRRQLPCQ